MHMRPDRLESLERLHADLKQRQERYSQVSGLVGGWEGGWVGGTLERLHAHPKQCLNRYVEVGG